MKTARAGWEGALIFLMGGFLVAQNVLKPDGCVDKETFLSGWRTFSDLDDRIPLESRSWEAQQQAATLDEIQSARLEIARLMALMELDRQERLAMREYEKALELGLKTNLLKCFWRMAWLTWNTSVGPAGKTKMVKTGETLGKLLLGESGSTPIAFAKVVGIVKDIIPKKYSRLPGREGKWADVGVNALILENVKNMDKNPEVLVAKVVAKVMEKSAEVVLPSAELSDEEVAVLRQQHIDHQGIKQALDENYQINKDRQAQIDALNAQIAATEQKAKEWEEREKQRVFCRLNKDCRNKPIKVTLQGPARVRPGPIISLKAEATGGSGDYEYLWASSTPGAGGGTTVGDTNISGSSVQFQIGSAGSYLIAVQVKDRQMEWFTGYATLSIEAGDLPAPPPPAPPPPQPASDPFVGDWKGYMRTIPNGSKDAINASAPIVIHIVRKGNSYLVQEEVEGESELPHYQVTRQADTLLLVYRGPVIDTKGQVHNDSSMDATLRLTVQGNTMTGGGTISLKFPDISSNMTLSFSLQKVR